MESPAVVSIVCPNIAMAQSFVAWLCDSGEQGFMIEDEDRAEREGRKTVADIGYRRRSTGELAFDVFLYDTERDEPFDEAEPEEPPDENA